MSSARKDKKNYSALEISVMLDLVEALLPMGQDDWMELALQHNRHMLSFNPTGNSARTHESLKQKFKTLKNSKKPTGDPDCPPEIVRAKRCSRDIEQNMAVADMDSNPPADIGNDEEEIGREVSSSDDELHLTGPPAARTPRTPTTVSNPASSISRLHQASNLTNPCCSDTIIK